MTRGQRRLRGAARRDGLAAYADGGQVDPAQDGTADPQTGMWVPALPVSTGDGDGPSIWSGLSDAAAGVTSYIARQRAEGVSSGLVDPDTGLPTRLGLQDAVMKMASGFVGGGQGSARPGFASRTSLMYNPPSVAQRLLSADYPMGAVTDGAGKLVSDIEGRPLTAPNIVGRADGSGVESPLAPEGVNAIATALPGSGIAPVAAREIRGNAGMLRSVVDPVTGQRSYTIYIDKGLSGPAQGMVARHEIGHAIDEVAGGISTDGLSSELKQVYNTLNNPNAGYQAKLFGPVQNGYAKTEAPRELMAEAIRGYMANPNWLKSVAPKTAAAIRGAVNNHPVLSKVVQFNSAAGLGIFGAQAGYDQGNATGGSSLAYSTGGLVSAPSEAGSMSGTNTGVAAGFGGFAATPDGQMTYMNRQHNPYAFLQQDQTGLAAAAMPSTAPAADQALAGGGLAGLTPQQEMQWTKFLRMRGMGGGQYRRGGRVRYQRLDEGGDAGSGNGEGAGAAGGTNGNMGGADAPGNSDSNGPSGPGAGGPTGGFDSGGFGSNPSSGYGASNNAGFGNEDPSGDPTSAFDAPGFDGFGQVGGLTSAGQVSALGMPAAAPSVPESLDIGSVIGHAGLSAIPGATMANNALGNPAGLSAMGPGATMGSQVGGMLGGMVGGPVGGMVGSAMGAVAGAHGTQDNPGMGGTNSNSGPSGSQGSASFDQPQGSDITGLIRRIRAAMGNGNTGAVQPQALATGGRAGGPPSSTHFHGGSGLVHSASDGRADAVHTSVPRGAYILPADVVSGLGQGNTAAGARKIGGMLRPAMHFASGGSVPVRLSGGEFVVHPAHVAAFGNGNLKAGSDKLDTMVGHVRRISAAQVARMPPPK